MFSFRTPADGLARTLRLEAYQIRKADLEVSNADSQSRAALRIFTRLLSSIMMRELRKPNDTYFFWQHNHEYTHVDGRSIASLWRTSLFNLFRPAETVSIADRRSPRSRLPTASCFATPHRWILGVVWRAPALFVPVRGGCGRPCGMTVWADHVALLGNNSLAQFWESDDQLRIPWPSRAERLPHFGSLCVHFARPSQVKGPQLVSWAETAGSRRDHVDARVSPVAGVEQSSAIVLDRRLVCRWHGTPWKCDRAVPPDRLATSV